MKKKRNNRRSRPRDQHWTEPEQGRAIDFADKYLPGDESAEASHAKRAAQQNSAAKKARSRQRKKRVLAVSCCLLIVCIGYIGADVFIIRHAAPLERAMENRAQEGNLNALPVAAQALHEESLSLDGAVMLSSVVDDTLRDGYTGIVFDAKRSDGTVGYRSTLALVDTFGAVSAPATALAQSVEKLRENGILPIARISCYADNVAPAHAPDMALMSGESFYIDSDGNTWLNPDSELTYQYIRDLIQECNAAGVTVFLLADCDLPAEAAEGHQDGYDALAARLSAELGTSVKLLQEITVTVNEPAAPTEDTDEDTDDEDADDEDSDGEENTDDTAEDPIAAAVAALPAPAENQLYTVRTDLSPATLKPYLDAAGLTLYCIEEV
ncbi:MAG: UxaA family hydrolase [Eubacterium sp.]|nr:UxaA family hydrolase [Eubacterium sp.]